MAILFKDRVKETSTDTGTGNFDLAGAVTGFQSFNAAYGTGSSNKFYYCIEGGAEWEVGIGYMTDSDTLVRETILESSNSDNEVSFSAGTKTVFSTVAAQAPSRMCSNPPKVWRGLLDQSGTSAPTATVLENTLGGTINWSRTGAGRYTGTLASAFPQNKTFIHIKSAPGPSTITPAGDGLRIMAIERFAGSSDTITIVVGDGFDGHDDMLIEAGLEILVYP